MSIDIEKCEALLRAARASVGTEMRMGPPIRVVQLKPPRLELTRVVNGKPTAVLSVVPEDCKKSEVGGAWFANTLRVKRTTCSGGCTECRVVHFAEPAKVKEDGIYLKSLGVKHRLPGQKEKEWDKFNPWLIFSGDQKIQKMLRSQGVRYT